LIDDLFLVHETIAEYLEDALGVSLVFGEVAVFAVYGLLTIWLVIRFRTVLLNTDYIFLGLAVGFVLLSAVTDIGTELADVWDPRLTFLEDMFKFCGIVSWLTYTWRAALKQVV
jgi:hypothetical protein